MDTSFHHLVKTECGRARLAELQARPGPIARLRFLWFLAIATLRDLRKRSIVSATRSAIKPLSPD